MSFTVPVVTVAVTPVMAVVVIMPAAKAVATDVAELLNKLVGRMGYSSSPDAAYHGKAQCSQ